MTFSPLYVGKSPGRASRHDCIECGISHFGHRELCQECLAEEQKEALETLTIEDRRLLNQAEEKNYIKHRLEVDFERALRER